MKISKTAFLLGCKKSDCNVKNSKLYINKKIRQMKMKNRCNVFDYYEIGKIVHMISRELKEKSSHSA